MATTDRYVIIPADLIVDVHQSESQSTHPYIGALRADAVYFCANCGCLVYRTDLHDSWHDKMDRAASNASLLNRIGD